MVLEEMLDEHLREHAVELLMASLTTPCHGREIVTAELVSSVMDNRVTTVTGVGGVGQTRLVAEVVPSLSDRLQAPITVVELAPVRAGGVGAAVAEALEFTPRRDAIVGEVVEYLSAARWSKGIAEFSATRIYVAVVVHRLPDGRRAPPLDGRAHSPDHARACPDGHAGPFLRGGFTR